jgi:hypothetical protein
MQALVGLETCFQPFIDLLPFLCGHGQCGHHLTGLRMKKMSVFSTQIQCFFPKSSGFWKSCLLLQHISLFHRIGWWENLQETPVFDGKHHGFL